ncbi:MAG: cold-shock protein [Actinobacteria bacterium]|nr:cold-shock protein [Actinomycetota bacterium]
MAEGTVKWFDDSRGFGFIAQPGGDDIFVHFSAIQGESALLREGQKVRFDIVQSLKGNKATNVEIVNSKSPKGPVGKPVKSAKRY